MKRGFSAVEVLVVVTILAILAGMIIPAIGLIRKSAQRANASKDNTEQRSQWKTTDDLLANGRVSVYIITDPDTGQKWLIVKSGNGITTTPYDATKKPVEKVE